jgi:two-component system cell cycle sensor histidine kinase/response regulator CckA
LTGAGRILIVDDSMESLKLLSGILGAEGYDVRPADSGELALATVMVSPPELILLDTRMPGMDGVEVCRKLKSRAESRDIPVIFLSASLDFEDRLESLESGGVDFINKPFRREELLARLKTHLELARLRKDLEQRVAKRTAQLQAVNDRLKRELESRRKIEEELRESEHRFRSIADTTPAGICLFSQEGLLIYANEWFLTFCGSTAEQIVGGGWSRFIHPEDVDRLVEEITAAVKEQRSTHIEHRLLRSDGEYRWVAAKGNPRLVDGEFVGYIVIILDITELKRSQERALARQTLESLGALTAGIAHNFNNLMSVILAHSDLALDEIPSESTAHENVSTIATVALRAAEIVNLLMVYAGSDNFGAPETVDLSSLIHEMAQLLQASVSAATSLHLKLEKDLTPVWANSAEIRQVIISLVMNASEALEKRPGTVELSTAKVHVYQGSNGSAHPDLREGDYVLLEVSDTGCGMAEEIKARAFDPFFTTKFLGRGLGLASVQGFVRGAGGAISVVSSPGQGSTFKIWWPCWESELDRDDGRQRARSNLVLPVNDEDVERR